MRCVFARWSGGLTRKPFGSGLGQVGGHQAFEDFAVFKAQAHPQALRARAGSERLAGERFGVAELAHEIDALDLAQVDGDDGPGSVEQFEFAFLDELGRRTYPETESRSILRTITFLCVEGMESGPWTSDSGWTFRPAKTGPSYLRNLAGYRLKPKAKG